MNLRYVDPVKIKSTVRELCVTANTILRDDVLAAIKDLYEVETEGTPAKNMLKVLVDNAEIAAAEKLALCQDTGMVAVFVEMGNRVVIKDALIQDIINEGIKEAYEDACFRRSVVDGPLSRNNTGTNTPGIIHLEVKNGDKIMIAVMPKGFGSENKSRSIMLDPTADAEEIVKFCVETVKLAGPDACPPYILGVGLGGTMEHSAFIAKKALLRDITLRNQDTHIADLENKIKEEANNLGIGIMGLGGISTVIGVNIETAPTHIAGMPLTVNVSCHATRSASTEI